MTEIPLEWVLRGAASMVLRQHGEQAVAHCIDEEVRLAAAGAKVWAKIIGYVVELIRPDGEA